MAVNLSPVGGVAAQFFDNNGVILSGGKIYTYSAGTTTNQTTYTSAAGTSAHTNPIILDSAGRVPSGEIWLTDGLQYKFVIKNANDVTIGTYDNIIGINSNFVNFLTETEVQTATAGQTVFTLTTMQYQPGTNNLTVYVDGVNQIDGSTYSYVETSATVVTFTAGLHVGALVKFTTAQTLSTGVTDASLVTYDPPFTGSVATTVENKLAQYVSVLDFGADPTGSVDSATAFSNAIAEEGVVFIPEGTYIFNSEVTITNPVTLIGSGQGSTFLHRNYSPTVDDDGIFNIRDGGSLISMRDMTLRSLSGQTGGCLLSIVNTNAQAIGQMTFTNMGFTTTGTSTHQYTIYMDGTARTSAPIGIRGVDMFGCSVFGGGISTLLVKGVLKFSFLGGGCYPAGGAAGSNVRFDGVSGVETQSFQFLPADCSCPISFDRAILGIFGCGVMGAITNTANTENVYGFGFSGSVQQNWGNSMFFDTSTGLKLTVNQKIGNTGATTNFALEMIGAITGFQKTGTVTKIGQTGVSYSTICPDTKTFSFINQSGKMFSISTGGGASALVFADYKSATITLLSNPSTEFQASATPGAGLTGIFKSVNSHQISVKNNTGASVTYDVLNFGNVSSTTDPA